MPRGERRPPLIHPPLIPSRNRSSQIRGPRVGAAYLAPEPHRPGGASREPLMRRPSLFLFAVLSLLAGCATSPNAGPAAPPASFHVERSGQGRPIVFIPGLSSSGEV